MCERKIRTNERVEMPEFQENMGKVSGGVDIVEGHVDVYRKSKSVNARVKKRFTNRM